MKGNIHWVCAQHAYEAEVRLYDRLFAVPFPGLAATGRRRGRRRRRTPVVAGDDKATPSSAGERNWLDDLNPDAKRVITAYVEPALKDAQGRKSASSSSGTATSSPISRDSKPGKPVFNRAVTLRDSWAKASK